MKISVALENGLLPDRFGKFAEDKDLVDGHPNRSFPIEITDVPEHAKSLALVFVDFDSIPVCGFCWIHWLACDIPANTQLIPEHASFEQSVPMVQGSNSDWSRMAGGSTNPLVYCRYAGPYPPDKTHVYTLTVYALDCESLGLEEGYLLNDMRKTMAGHVIDRARVELPSRAS